MLHGLCKEVVLGMSLEPSPFLGALEPYPESMFKPTQMQSESHIPHSRYFFQCDFLLVSRYVQFRRGFLICRVPQNPHDGKKTEPMGILKAP